MIPAILNDVLELMRSDPILLLFAVLGLGYLVGRIRFGSFELGPVAGVLLAGLVFGHFKFEINPTVQSLGFTLFIFSIGFQAGPRFFSVIRRDGMRYLMLALVVGLIGFLATRGLVRIFQFKAGTEAGLLAGAMTSTPTLAAADATVRGGSYQLPEGFTQEQVLANITAGYAITYFFGVIGLILLIRFIPRLLGVRLDEEARVLELAQTAEDKGRCFSPSDVFVRAVQVEREDVIGLPLQELYSKVEIPLTVTQIRRGGELIPVRLETCLEKDDLIGFVAVVDEAAWARLKDKQPLGRQVYDTDLLSYSSETAQLVVTKKQAVGLTLGELDAPQRFVCFVSEIRRQGVHVEFSPGTPLERGDVLTVDGPVAGLERMAEKLGHLERDVDQTDLLTFSLGIVAGVLVGALSVKIGGVPIGLGSAGGLLACGLVIGFLRSIYPVFGRVPSAARSLLLDLGLLMFMACVGLQGGQTIVSVLKSSGLALIACGVVVTCLPVLIGYAFGRRVLKMNPVMLLAAITGSMTSSAALSIVNDQAKSTLPGIGYAGAYAFANIILTLLGALILLL
jgi:putative transport protein